MREFSLDIRIGSPLHTRICDALNARYSFSAQRMSTLHDKWRRAEDIFQAFAPERDVDAARRFQREQGGKPQYTTIILPYTYAQLMSAHSYWTTVFLARDPIFQIAGRHGEAEDQVMAMEALLAYQVQVGEMLAPLFFWLLDAGKLGLGILCDYWCEEVNSVSRMLEVEDTFGDLTTGQTIGLGTFKKKLVTEQRRGYYGSKLFNTRPFDYYPDTRVPLWAVQRGEFWGRHSEVGWHELLRKANSGEFVNTEEFKKLRGGATDTGREQGSPNIPMPNDDSAVMTYGTTDLSDTGPYGLMTMEVDIVPNQWGLSEVGVPEKWVFTGGLQGGNGGGAGTNRSTSRIGVVLEARPIGCDHNKFRVNTLQIEPEAYALQTRSLPQIIEPLQNTMDWLINSHMYAVRKTMNNQFLVDPSRVMMSDFQSPQQGGAIRARPAAYGTDLRQAVAQMQVQDLTAGHLGDMVAFNEFAQRASGVNDQLMGQVNSGGRKTAQEVRTSSTFGINRQKTICEFFSMTGFTPLVQRLIQNSQQYFDMDTKMRVVGDLAMQAGPGFVQVNPDSISGFYDFIPVDGTLPIDRYQMASLWQQMFAQIARVPQIVGQYDMAKVFAWVAQLAGLRNINRMKLVVAQPGMSPEQAAGGNVVNLRDVSRTVEPGQNPGMGTTG